MTIANGTNNVLFSAASPMFGCPKLEETFVHLPVRLQNHCLYASEFAC
jgi:hypothetical protein